MATTSEVKAGLNDVADEIRNERQALKRAQQRVAAAAANLANLPTKYSDIIGTIDDYTGDDDFELHAKSEKDRLASEFNALKSKADGADTDLSAYDFSV